MSEGFDYGQIPLGHYDRIFRGPKGIRRLWHVSKFERVLDCLPAERGGALLDVGCCAGTLLSMVPEQRFGRQLGIDIAAAQIAYASAHHGTSFRAFATRAPAEVDGCFDAITVVEVLEHLRAPALRTMLRELARLLRPGGTLVLTTPNYASAWPVIELGLGWFSDVSYEQQHLTRFTYRGLERQLQAIEPAVWSWFEPRVKTTTHFLTPFLAGLSYEVARSLSRAVPVQAWHHPFGNLILAALTRSWAPAPGPFAVPL